MAEQKKQQKVLTRRRKFIPVEIPFIDSRIELLGNEPKDIENKLIKLDLTRQLKGKSIEVTFKIKTENKKSVAYPTKLKLMPYFIRRMIRKRISYVEDSFQSPSQTHLIQIKPFLITRKRVSAVVKKTLRNKTKNWLEDYIKKRTDQEIFEDIITNKLQKSLSLNLKKTYPLSLCEIRMFEIKRELEDSEIPELSKEEKEESKAKPKEQIIDQLAEIEQEKIKKAEEEMKQAQKKASDKEKKEEDTLKNADEKTS